jgi:hypothetical protein
VDSAKFAAHLQDGADLRHLASARWRCAPPGACAGCAQGGKGVIKKLALKGRAELPYAVGDLLTAYLPPGIAPGRSKP